MNRYLLVPFFLLASFTFYAPARAIDSMTIERCPCGCHTGGHADPIRALEIATLEQRLYRQVDYPTRVRTLRSEQIMTQARIDSLKRRLAEYAPMDRFQTGKALIITIEQTKLELLREELHLKDLQARQMIDAQTHRQRARLLALKVNQAQRISAGHRASMYAE